MTFAKTITVAIAAALIATQSLSQTEARSPALFDSRNAIIDTAIPFAIGAQEAQQSLRGSFGWQTFQEGLVEGVYYRFDPDGYARFAPTPRLDQDQFEVVCVPRSFVCTGQKGGFHLALNQRGALQIQLENLGAGDQFFLFDGTNELPLPARIFEPLDIRLESLLMSGGELVVKRNGQSINNISLAGFSAVAAYIRWVAAGQDYSVLPRNWPIPNSATSATSRSITQPETWTRPVLSSQSVIPYPNTSVQFETRSSQQQQFYDPTRPLTRILAPDETQSIGPSDEISALQSEIQMLTQDLSAPRQLQGTQITKPISTAGASGEVEASKQILEQVLLRLSKIEDILSRLETFNYQNVKLSTPSQPSSMHTSLSQQSTIGLQAIVSGEAASSARVNGTMIASPEPLRLGQRPSTSQHQLEAKSPPITEKDIVAAIETLLSQQSNLSNEAAAIESNSVGKLVAETDSSVVLNRAIVERILAELDQTSVTTQAPISRIQQVLRSDEESLTPTEDDQVYKSLSEYFKTTTVPAD